MPRVLYDVLFSKNEQRTPCARCRCYCRPWKRALGTTFPGLPIVPAYKTCNANAGCSWTPISHLNRTRNPISPMRFGGKKILHAIETQVASSVGDVFEPPERRYGIMIRLSFTLVGFATFLRISLTADMRESRSAHYSSHNYR